MHADPFGNLKDWGPVLHQLQNLSAQGQLDQHQPGLVRLLAYNDNWRLREEGLRCAAELAQPDEAVIRQVLRIFADENLYYEVRSLAAETLATMFKNQACHFPQAIITAIHKTLVNLLATPQPPLFAQPLRIAALVFSERFGVAFPAQ